MLRTLRSFRTNINEGIEDLLKASEMEYHTSDDWRDKKPKDFVVVIEDDEVILKIDDLYKNIENYIRSKSGKLFLFGKIDGDDVTVVITKTNLRKLAVNPYEDVDVTLMYDGADIETTMRASEGVYESYIIEKGAKKPKKPKTPEEKIKDAQAKIEELDAMIKSGRNKKGDKVLSTAEIEKLKKQLNSKEDSIYKTLVDKYKKEHPDATPEDIEKGIREANPSLNSILDNVKARRGGGKPTTTTTTTPQTPQTPQGDPTPKTDDDDDDDDDDDNDTPAKTNKPKDKGKDPFDVKPEDAMKKVIDVANDALSGKGSALATAFGLLTFLTFFTISKTKKAIDKHQEKQEELDARLSDARRSFSSAVDKQYKDDPMNATTMALFYDKDGNPRNVDDLQTSFGNIDPNTLTHYKEVAEKFSKTEEFKQAQAYNEAISKLDPKDKAELDAFSTDQAKLHMANAKLAQQNALIGEMEKEIAKVENTGSKLDKSYLKALKRDLEHKKKERDSITEEVKTQQAAVDKRRDAITRIANANKDTIPQLKEFQTNEMTPVAMAEKHKQLLEKLEKCTNESGAPLTDEEKETLKKEIEKSEDDIREKAVEIFKKDNPDFQGTEEEMMKKIQEANKDNEVVAKALENSLTRNPVGGGQGGQGGQGDGDDEIKKLKDEWNAMNEQLKSGKDKDGNDLTDDQKAQLEKDADTLQDKVIDKLAENYKKDHPDATDDEVQAEIRKQHPDIVPKMDEVTGKGGTKVKVQHKLGPRGGKYFRTKGPNATKWSEWQSGDYKKVL